MRVSNLNETYDDYMRMPAHEIKYTYKQLEKLKKAEADRNKNNQFKHRGK